MADINQFLADPGVYPSQGGMPRGTVGIRPQAMPEMDPEPAMQVGRNIQALGKAIAGAGKSVQQGMDLQASKAKAKDTLAAIDYSNQWNQRMDTYNEESLRDPDTDNHPQRVRAYSEQLTNEFNKKLEPLNSEAQMRFHIETGQYMTLLNRQAERFSTQALTQRSQAVVGEAEQQFERGMLEQQTDPVMQQWHAERLQNTYQSLTQRGLMYPETARVRFQGLMDKVTTTQGELLARTDPDTALQHFTALKDHKPGMPGMPEVPYDKLPALINIAQQEQVAQTNRGFHLEARAEKYLKEQQDLNGRTLFSKVVEAQNLEDLDTLQRQVNTRAVDRTTTGIDGQYQHLLTTAIQAERRRLLSPREKSDENKLRAWEIVVEAGYGDRTPEEVKGLMVKVMGDTSLKVEDSKGLAKALGEELRANHFSKVPGYTEYKQQLKIALDTTNPFDTFDENGTRQSFFGIREFNQRLSQVINAQGLNAASEQLPIIADEVADAWSQRILGKAREALGVPPKIPPGFWRMQPNPDALNDTDIANRFSEAETILQQRVREGAISQVQADGIRDQLGFRRKFEEKYWNALRQKGMGKPPGGTPTLMEPTTAPAPTRTQAPQAAPPASSGGPEDLNKRRQQLRQQILELK